MAGNHLNFVGRFEFLIRSLRKRFWNSLSKMWWPDWHDLKVDAFGRPVAYLELKLLGALCTLGNLTTHFMVSLQTNASEEVHRKFF